MERILASGHQLEIVRISPAEHRTNAPTLVFLHEGLGSVALWKDFPQRVAAATRCGALVYSRYGYGKSDRLSAPRAVDYMHREALETLPQMLEQLDVRDPILIGHSDGASIALIHAGSEVNRARAVVAMAPHVFVEDLTVASIAQAKTTFENTDLAVKLGRYHDDALATFWGWNDIWLHPDFRAWNIEAYLPNVRVPLLLIQGRDDQYGTLAQIDAIERRVQGAVTKVVLDECAHSPHVDQREEVIEEMVRFVALVERE